MSGQPILCPTCKVPPNPGTTICPQCHEDLAALMQLQFLPSIYYNQAVQMAEQGEVEKAIVRLHLALDRDPTRPEPLVLLGELYARKKQWHQAAAYWEQALQIKPEEPTARQGLARAQEEERKNAQAERRTSGIRWAMLAVAFLAGLMGAGMFFAFGRAGQPVTRPTELVLVAAPSSTPLPTITPFPTAEPTQQPTPSSLPTMTVAPTPLQTSTPLPTETPSPWSTLGQMRVGCNSVIDFAPVVARKFRLQMLAGGGPDGLISYACCSSKGSAWWVNGAWMGVNSPSAALRVGDIRETDEFTATVVSRMRFDVGCNDGEAMDAAIWYLGK